MSSDRARNITTCWFEHTVSTYTTAVTANKYVFEVEFNPPSSISGKRCRMIAGPYWHYYDSGNKGTRISLSGMQFPYNTLSKDNNVSTALNPSISGAGAVTATVGDTTPTNMSTIIYLGRNLDVAQFGPPIITCVPDGPVRLQFTVEWPRQSATTIAGTAPYEHEICLSFEPIE